MIVYYYIYVVCHCHVTAGDCWQHFKTIPIPVSRGGQACSLAILSHVPVSRHWWGSKPGSIVPHTTGANSTGAILSDVPMSRHWWDLKPRSQCRAACQSTQKVHIHEGTYEQPNTNQAFAAKVEFGPQFILNKEESPKRKKEESPKRKKTVRCWLFTQWGHSRYRGWQTRTWSCRWKTTKSLSY